MKLTHHFLHFLVLFSALTNHIEIWNHMPKLHSLQHTYQTKKFLQNLDLWWVLFALLPKNLEVYWFSGNSLFVKLSLPFVENKFIPNYVYQCHVLCFLGPIEIPERQLLNPFFLSRLNLLEILLTLGLTVTLIFTLTVPAEFVPAIGASHMVAPTIFKYDRLAPRAWFAIHVLDHEWDRIFSVLLVFLCFGKLFWRKLCPSLCLLTGGRVMILLTAVNAEWMIRARALYFFLMVVITYFDKLCALLLRAFSNFLV